MKSGLVGVAAIAGLAASSLAQDHAILSFSGGTQFSSYYGSVIEGDTIGWRFTVSQNVTVTSLGAWNGDSSGGVSSDHRVGIWDSNETLLTDTTVTPNSPIDGIWRWEATSQVTLVPGEEYTIGLLDFGDDDDNYISGASSVTMSADVNYVTNAYPLALDLGFTYPLLTTPGSIGRFGPNFMYTVGGGDCFFQTGCAADVDGDGDADVNDFFAYLDLFDANDACADVNEDGTVDVNDFFGYLDLFDIGC